MLFEDFAAAVAIWNDSAAHRFSYLVLPVSAYFAWLRRGQVRQLQPRPSWLGLLPAALFALLWLVSAAAQVNTGTQAAALGMLLALVLAVLGPRICRQLAFPLLFLWLLVPFGDSLLVALMELTAVLTLAGVRLFGMSAQADGMLLIAEGARYVIVESCAALDFILGNLVIALVFAQLMYQRNAKRALYVALSIPVAILANAMRTTGVVLITWWSDGRINLAIDHAVFGWSVFAAVVLIEMYLGWCWRDPVAAARPAAAPAAPAAIRPPWLIAGATLAVAAAGPLYAATLPALPAPAGVCIALAPAAAPPGADWRPVFPQASVRWQRELAAEGGAVDVYVAYYWGNGGYRRSAEPVSWRNRMFDGRTWAFLARGRDSLRIDGASREVIRETLRGGRDRRRTVYYWYWIDGEYTANPVHAKWLRVRAVLGRGELRSAAVALSVEAGGDDKRPHRAVQSVLDGIDLQAALAGARAPAGDGCD